MTRLVLNGHEIDLYENDPVNLNLQYSDISDLSKAKSSFSQTFRVPLTANNEDFFGAVQSPQSLSANWNSKTKIPAQLYDDTILIISGYAQVKHVYVQKGKYVDVELAVFGEISSLSKDIGDDKLSDLDLSAYNHALTYNNVAASWAGTSSSPFNGSVRYSIVDRGQNWSGSSTWANPTLNVNEATPFIRVKLILDAIMSAAGYTYTSTWLDSMSDMYLLCMAGGRYVSTNNDDEIEKFAVGLNANTSISGTSLTNLLLFENGSFYDIGANVVLGVYTAPYEGFYQFQFTGQLAAVTGTGNLALKYRVNGAAVQTIVSGGVASIGTTGFIGYYSAYLEQNDTVSVGYQFGDGSTSAQLVGNGSTGVTNTCFTLYDISYAQGTVDMSLQMPDMKQIDFFQALKSAFNLVLIPDKLDPKKLEIEPFDTYMASGAVKDWSDKVDYSKDVRIRPTTDLQAKQYDWTMVVGNDIANKYIFDSADRVYGRFRIDDNTNDFANGEKVIESKFAPFITSLIPDTSRIIHRAITDGAGDQAVIQEAKPKLAFWNGLVDTITWSYVSTAQTQFPMFSVYEDAPDAVTPLDDVLLFGSEIALHPIQGLPINTLYRKYYRNYVNQLYSADSRKISLNIVMTITDVSAFEFNDKIFIDDTYYRVLSIKNYSPTNKGSVLVEMIKIIGDVADCAEVPNFFNSNGSVRFTDSSGNNTNTPSAKCCLHYGYVVSKTDNKCYQPSQLLIQ